MTPERRRLVWTVARGLVAVALLAFVVARVDFAALGEAFGKLNATTLMALLGLVVAQQCLLAVRFFLQLRSLTRDAPGGPRRLTIWSVLGDQEVSTTFNAVLPSTVGGDVVRFARIRGYFSSEHTEASATAALFLDRLIGLAALVSMPVVAGLSFGMGQFSPALLVGAASLLGVAVAFAEYPVRWLGKVMPTRARRLSDFVLHAGQALAMVPPRTRLAMFAASLGYQFCTGLFYELPAQVWGLGSSVHAAIWLGIPAVTVAATLPVTIGGIGLRESLYVTAFGFYGLPREPALALALLWMAQGLLTAVAGGLVLVVSARRAGLRAGSSESRTR